jgi:hypothetical protein
MEGEPQPILKADSAGSGDVVEMPRPTVAPFVLSLGMVLVAAGVVTSMLFLIVGGAILVAGLCIWIAQLLPGRGHIHERLVEPARRARRITGLPGTVELLQAGKPGYRMRLPERVHPISAGLRGGILGGLVMPLPAFVYGIVSGHGIWMPVNLLAGMVLPGIGKMSIAELEQFHPSLLLIAVIIHAVLSVIIGLVYGVMLPTLPPIPRPLAWGGLLMPLLWTAVSFGVMGVVNPVLAKGVDWPWFIVCQFLFGIVAAGVVIRSETLGTIRAGLLGGVVGGLIMPIPAVLWSVITGHGVWYPVNLLAGMALPRIGMMQAEELQKFHPDWLAIGIVIHALMAMAFGLVYGVLLPKLPPIPGPLAWGGLVTPMLWTGTSYGLMGVVNPPLQQRVHWPWFIASQFVFGVVAAVVVIRSEMVHIPPAGRGPDRLTDFLVGEEGAGRE